MTSLVDLEALRTALVGALAADPLLFVSSITAWDIGQRASRRRISLPMGPTTWFKQRPEASGVALAAIGADILIASSLPGAPLRDPADCSVVTAAREFGYRVVTRDRQIIGYAEQGCCRTLAR